jgi:3-oxoadipate enol-lactonase
MRAFTYRGRDGCPLFAVTFGLAEKPVGIVERPVLFLLHAGGPDHQSLIPLAQKLASDYDVILPDIRGYGQSVCTDPSSHTWAQYADDVISLLDHCRIRQAIVGGVGLGTTISLRTAVAYPGRVRALVLVSVEDIEDDEAKQEEIKFLDAFAERVRAEGIEAAWEPILADFPPIVGVMVREAIPRSDPASIAAAAAIGHDRSFRSVDELAVITAPTLIIPGIDKRHPTALAEEMARVLPRGRLAPVALSIDLQTADDFAGAFAPAIHDFLACLGNISGYP